MALLLACLALLGLALAGCGVDDDGDDGNGPSMPLMLSYDFGEGDHGWQADFADYGPAFEMELDSGIRDLPASLERNGTGFLLGGTNRTDDLFMFMWRKIGAGDGVRAGEVYQVSYRVLFASDAPTGCVGVGGAPGEGVWMKAGVVAAEPAVELVGDYYELNLDKDNQASGGEDVWLLGDIANGIPCEEALEAGSPYAEVEHTYTHPTPVRADDSGQLWLIVGTDSGFESRTELYYMLIEVTLEPVAG